MIWTNGTVFFLMAKAALAFLPTALFVALRPPVSFWQAQFVQVFLMKRHSASSPLVSAAPTSFPFLFFLTLVLSLSLCSRLRLCFCLRLSGRSSRNCLFSPPLLPGYNGFPDTRFSRETTRLISWPDGERFSCPKKSHVVSLLLLLLLL